MANKHILITGGAGFIGFNLARAALSNGDQVTLLDNFSRGRQDAAFETLRKEVRVINHDLTTPLPTSLLGQDADEVYHLAAVVGVQQSNEAPHRVLRTNLLTTLHLLDWCAEHPPGALFFSSTSEVADGAVRVGLAKLPTPEDVPLVIDAPQRPRSGYATSKMAGELLCLNYAHAYRFKLRMGRYHNIYGPRMGYEHVIPQVIERALGRQNPFIVYGSQQFRAFCYIDDAVRATRALMELATSDPLLVNIGNDREPTRIKELTHSILRLADFEPEFYEVPAPAGSPDRRCPDISWLYNLTGYIPEATLEEGLKKTFAWYQEDLAAARPFPGHTGLVE